MELILVCMVELFKKRLNVRLLFDAFVGHLQIEEKNNTKVLIKICSKTNLSKYYGS